MSIYHSTRARKVEPIPVLWNMESLGSARNIDIHGTVIKNHWIFFKGGLNQDFIPIGDWDAAATYVGHRLLNEPGYLSSLAEGQKYKKEDLLRFVSRSRGMELKNIPVQGLVELYNQAHECWLEYDLLNVYPWYLGGDVFQELVRKKISQVALDLVEDEFTILVTNPQLSFSAEEELGLARLAMLIHDNGYATDALPDDALSEIDRLVERFYWIPFGYDGPDTYDRKHYIRVLSEMLADNKKNFKELILKYEERSSNLIKNQETIMARYRLGDDIRRLLERVHLLARMTDERKECEFQVHVVFHQVLGEMANRLQVELRDLKFILPGELSRLLDKSQDIQKIAAERQRLWLLHYTPEEIRTFVGSEAEEKCNELLGESRSTQEIRGSVACRGSKLLTVGTARVLVSTQEMGRLAEGDILVASMTTPEFVPAMRRSAAIVTDEGGITCHAAIVSRELNLPCIIGTRNATKLINDGDLIEVDTMNGIVKKIS